MSASNSHFRKFADGDLSMPVPDVVSADRATKRRTPLFGVFVVLLLFLTAYYAKPEDWIPGLSKVPLEKIIGFAGLLAALFSLRHIRVRLTWEFLFLALMVGQLFLASFMSPVSRGDALQLTLTFSKVLIVVLAISAAVTTLRRLRALIFVQAVSVSVIASLAIWKGHLILGRLEGILIGNYTDPNELALGIVMLLPLCLALTFLSGSISWKIIWSISMLAMIYVVFLTGSRGGFLSLVVVTVICLWKFAIRGRRRYLLVLAGFAGLILVQLYGGMLVGRLAGTFNVKQDTAAAYGSAQARQQLFWRSIGVTLEHPLFGVGPGNFDEVSGQWHTTHNSFTLVSSEGGIPAFILYVLILLCAFKNLIAVERLAQGQSESTVMARALLASLAGYVVGSSFLSESYQFFPYILVAYTTALLSITGKAAALSLKSKLTQEAISENNLYTDTSESEMFFHTL